MRRSSKVLLLQPLSRLPAHPWKPCSLRPRRPAMPASPDSTGTTVRVVLGADLHARPAGQVAQVAATFASAVSLLTDSRSAEARSVLAVMGLGARAGETVTVWADGPDAASAVAAIAQVLTAAAVSH
jgi:phosphotransferase system HPr (HPr) family protein